MTSSIPIVVLASTGRTDRDVAVMSALLGGDGIVAVVHDLVAGGDGSLVLRRRVLRVDLPEGGGSGPGTGAASLLGPTSREETVPMEHACPGCALREDAVPTIADLLEDPGVRGVLLALPLGAEIFSASRTLAEHLAPGGALDRAHLGLTVSVTDVTGTIGELHHGDDALLAQLCSADVVVLTGEEGDAGDARPGSARRGRDVIDALRRPDSERHDDAHGPWFARALAGVHDDAALEAAHDPVTLGPGHGFAEATTADDGARVADSGVWALELTSDRAFHPDRLMARVDVLAGPHTTSRGRFWLPNRPDAVCGWEATGGTLCVGVAGPWEDHDAETALVVVGTGPGRARLRRAFEEALLTDAEIAAGPAAWLGRPDPLEAYLGSPADLYRP